MRLFAAAEVLAASFGDRAGATADQPPNASAAVRARFEWSFRHFLAPLKTASARIAEIVIGWHQELPFYNPVFVLIIRSWPRCTERGGCRCLTSEISPELETVRR
jgi:hypothetical protein